MASDLRPSFRSPSPPLLRQLSKYTGQSSDPCTSTAGFDAAPSPEGSSYYHERRQQQQQQQQHHRQYYHRHNEDDEGHKISHSQEQPKPRKRIRPMETFPTSRFESASSDSISRQQRPHKHHISSVRQRISSKTGSNSTDLLDRPRRTGRACLQCRSRKQKCVIDAANDEDPHAPCKRCLRNRFDCSFQEAEDQGPAPIPPNMGSNDILAVFRQLQKHENRIRALEDHLAATAAFDGDDVHSHDGDGVQSPFNLVLPHKSATTTGSGDRRSIILCRNDLIDGLASGDESIIPAGATIVPVAFDHDGSCRYPSTSGGSARFSSTSAHASNNTIARVGVEALQLDAPIATLRSLGAISQDGWRGRAVESLPPTPKSFDPVSRGHLSTDVAAQCVATYASCCHTMAPLLDEEMLHCIPVLRQRPILFLAICCVGARFWQVHPSYKELGMHVSYDALVQDLDESLARIFLRPNVEDFSLSSVQALLITAQWMPMMPSASSSHDQKKYESRYSEISAGSLLGLVGRYAHSMGLEAASLPPFEGFKGQRRAYKTWHNLLTCDANLMLTSAFPPSTQAAPAAETALLLANHGLMISEEDVRVAGLLELASIAQRAIPRAGLRGDISEGILERFNAELDKWERTWTITLRKRNIRYDQMPLTSARWYRLAINSSVLRPLLSTPLTASTRNFQYSFVEPLDRSLTAAVRILVAYTTSAEQYLPVIKHNHPSTFPQSKEEWTLDDASVRKVCFAVDSYWITLTFAVVFLALCYVRGRVDDQCARLLSPESSSSPSRPNFAGEGDSIPSGAGARRKVAPSSLLCRLLTLGLRIFERVCQIVPGPHPAHDLKLVVENVTRSVLPSMSTEASTSPSVSIVSAEPGGGRGGQLPAELHHAAILSTMTQAAVRPAPSPAHGSGLFRSGKRSKDESTAGLRTMAMNRPGISSGGNDHAEARGESRAEANQVGPSVEQTTANGERAQGISPQTPASAQDVALQKRLAGSGLQWLGEIWDKMMGAHGV